jgi:hypothetical protein
LIKIATVILIIFKHIACDSVPMLRFLIPFGILASISCSNEQKTIPTDHLRKETRHFFSNDRVEDRFLVEFVSSDPSAIRTEYTHFDILSGNLMLTIYDDRNHQLYFHKWAVSDCFTMADNHYLNEDQKIQKLLDTFEHFFDSEKFNSIADMQITGILASSDSIYRNDIETEANCIGFSFIQEDFCVMYARKSRHAVLLRALRKDLLKRYNLLNESTNLSNGQ